MALQDPYICEDPLSNDKHLYIVRMFRAKRRIQINLRESKERNRFDSMCVQWMLKETTQTKIKKEQMRGISDNCVCNHRYGCLVKEMRLID